MKKLYFIIITLLLSTIIKAQYNKSAELFEQFEERFHVLDSLIFTADNTPIAENRTTDINIYNTIDSIQIKIDSLIERKVDAQKVALKHETGLNITGQAYFRLDDNLSIDEEDAVSRYGAKVQADLRWHFLNSAVLHRKGRLNEIDLQGEIERKRRATNQKYTEKNKEINEIFNANTTQF